MKGRLKDWGLSLLVHGSVFLGFWIWTGRNLFRVSPPALAPSHTIGVSLTPSSVSSNKRKAGNAEKIEGPGEVNEIGEPPASQPAEPQGGSLEYTTLIRSQIQNSLRYPLSLRRRGIQGLVTLHLALDLQGKTQTATVLTSSGSSELDQLALEAVESAAPFPPPPSHPQASKLTLTLPIEFKIR